MLFKRALTAAAFLLSLALAGCSLGLNEKVSSPPVNVTLGSCLNTSGTVINNFVQGTLSQIEHDDYYTCVNSAVTGFLDYTAGKDQDSFTPDELGNFLTKYFITGREIPPALLKEAMEVKRAMIGGPTDRIQREDLRRLLVILGDLKEFTGAIRTSMPYNTDSFVLRSFDAKDFEGSLAILLKAAIKFGSTIEAGQQSYSFDHMQALIKELGTFLYGPGIADDESHWTNRVLRFSETIRPLKALLVSPPRNEITQSDWPKIYRLGPRFFVAFLRMTYYWKSPDGFLHGEGLHSLERIYREFEDNFQFVLSQRAGGKINTAEISDLLITLYNEKLLPCRPDTALQFVKVAFGKLFGDPMDLAKFEINKNSITHLHENITYAFEGLRGLEFLYRMKFGDGFQEGTLSRSDILAVPVEKILEGTENQDALSVEAVQSLHRTASELSLTFSDPSLTFGVSVPKRGRLENLSYWHMFKMHSMRTFSRLILQGYGNTATESASPAALKTFFDDTFPIIFELGYLDSNGRSDIDKRLLEASLFMYTSDGDGGLTLNEALELETLMLTTLERYGPFHEKIGLACGTTKKDSKEAYLIDYNCYKNYFVQNMAANWYYIPGMADYTTSHTMAERKAIFDRIAHFLKVAPGNDFNTGHTQSFILMPMYVELLFSHFDTNKDGFIDNAEADVGYPTFRPFLSQKAIEQGFKDPYDWEMIFNFLLANQQTPNENLAKYLLRRWVLGKEDFRIDRAQVITIFDKLLSF